MLTRKQNLKMTLFKVVRFFLIVINLKKTDFIDFCCFAKEITKTPNCLHKIVFT